MASFRCIACDEIRDDGDGCEPFKSRTTGQVSWCNWVCQVCINERDGEPELAEDLEGIEPWS